MLLAAVPAGAVVEVAELGVDDDRDVPAVDVGPLRAGVWDAHEASVTTADTMTGFHRRP